jgi:hypothetical protein
MQVSLLINGWWRPIVSVTLIMTLVAVSLVAASCQQRPPRSEEKATPEQRRIIGAGVPYLPEHRADKTELSQNMRLRREKAWDVFRQVTQEVSVANNSSIKGFEPNASKKLPLWQTWYTGSELPVLFRSAYEKLTTFQRKNRRPVCPEVLDSLFERHAKQSVMGLTPKELEQRLSQVKSLEAVRGISGRGVTMFSPGHLRHYMENYANVLKCEATRTSLNPNDVISPSNHTPCFASEFPSGFDFPYKLSQADFSHCKVANSPKPAVNHGGAVAIKTAWHKIGNGDVGVFDTSGTGIVKHLHDGVWTPDSLMAESNLTPEKMFSIKLMESDSTYSLESLHVVTKDVRDWIWITFWWSPDPNSDFGEDRPSSFKGTPWENYKMCVVTDFVEADPEPASHYTTSHPSLASALGATHQWAKPYTQCSNPYVEQGMGNVRTNCIGCHQHAGTKTNPEEVYLDDPSNANTAEFRKNFPNNGRSKIRANFPGEYLWSYDQGPDYFETEIISTVSNVDNGL